MAYPKKIVLYCPNGYNPCLVALVEDFVRDQVIFIAVVGDDCSKVEEIIDEIVVGKGDNDHYILTSSHPNESVEDAIRFADSLTGEFSGESQLVEI
jgi:hypothetical protein